MNTTNPNFWSSGAVPLIEPELLSSIIAAASDIALVVSARGKVLSVVTSATDLSYGKLDHWVGRDLRSFLTVESVPKFEAALAGASGEGASRRPVELNHKDNANWQFPVRYTMHSMGAEDAHLMLGRDLRPVAETQQRLVEAQLALEKGYEARREHDVRYRMLLGAISDAVLFVSADSERIVDISAKAAELLGASREALAGALLSAELGGAGLARALAGAPASDGGAPLEVSARRTGAALRASAQAFRAGGERMLMCRLEARDEPGEGAGDRLQRRLLTLLRRGADAVALTDARGTITFANEAFLDLTDAAHDSDVRGRPLSDFLGRGQVDLSILLENTRREGRLRMHATRFVGLSGASAAVEATTTWLADRDAPGMGIVVREVERARQLRADDAATAAAPGDLAELVGSASLRDIVAGTVDAVERMCIESAIAMTDNNRVAAAEMLGLSRQSLYVKLRKYGLLSRGADGAGLPDED